MNILWLVEAAFVAAYRWCAVVLIAMFSGVEAAKKWRDKVIAQDEASAAAVEARIVALIPEIKSVFKDVDEAIKSLKTGA